MNASLNIISCGFGSRRDILFRLQESGMIKICAHFDYENDDFSINMLDLVFNHAQYKPLTYQMPIALFQEFQEKNFLLFFANLGRLDSYTGGHTDYADSVYLFRCLTLYLFDLFLKENIQLILIGHLPHEIVDTLMERLAHFLEIPVRLAVTPPYQTGRFFSLSSSANYGLFKKNKIVGNSKEIDSQELIIQSKSQDKNNAWVILCEKIRQSKISELYSNTRLIIYNHALLKEYEKNISNITRRKEELPEKYVYFPLHYQPEASTISFANITFDDQVLCIESLAKKLPKEYVIVVKEHPSQVFYWRSALFFDRLASIPQVMVVPVHVDSHTLIKRSQFIATVSGTAGWEALHFGVPVVYFGYPTYREMSGAFAFSDDLDIQAEVLGYKVNQMTLKQELLHMQNTAYPGTLGELFTDNEQLNISTCINSFTSILKDFHEENPDYFNLHAKKVAQLRHESFQQPVALPKNFSSSPRRQPFAFTFWQKALLAIPVIYLKLLRKMKWL